MKILFISLGCDKNLVDSEVMLGLLTKHGYTLTDDETQADVIVINTCCFIHDAKEESINTILEMAQYKEQNLKALVVAGCLAERYKDEILKEIPEIDAVLGTTSYDSIVEAVNTALEENTGEHFEHYESIDYLPDNSEVERVVTTGNHMAYLKIAEGCDKRCSYCIIPKIRGRFRSVPMQELLNEAKRLASEGVKELVLVAQETTLYGKDLTGEKQLPLLLHELCKIEGIEWIRLLYCYPEEITDELIKVIKTEEKVCNYIDMPIQHSENRILQRMGRRTSREDLVAVIKKLRKEIPDITIRTTLITGFPGESQEDHEGLMNFVEECQFDRLGVFTYSPEEDTLAATFEDQIDEEVKEERRDELMSLQQEISYEHTQQLVGKTIKVMVEGYLFEDENCKIPAGEEAKFEALPEEYSHLYLALEGTLAAVICIEDPLREEAADVIKALKKAGISKVVMMTGDSERTAAAIAKRVGVDEYYSEVLPEDKANFITKETEKGRKVMMIGDGINDSPALSAASVGIAVSDGAEIAKEIADITISAESLYEVVALKKISNALLKRIHKNYRSIVGINSGLIVLGVAGVLAPATSALCHNVSTLLISLNSMKNLLPEE